MKSRLYLKAACHSKNFTGCVDIKIANNFASMPSVFIKGVSYNVLRCAIGEDSLESLLKINFKYDESLCYPITENEYQDFLKYSKGRK